MERFTEKLEDGRSILRRGFSGKVEFGFMTFVDGDAVEKLSKYEDGYLAFYHEERLYSVRDIERKIVSLVYAKSPYEAIEKVRGMQ